MVEHKTVTQGIKMSKGVELIFITRQEIVTLPKVEPIVDALLNSLIDSNVSMK